MIATKNSIIADKVLRTLIGMVSRKSSSHYSLIVMDSLIGKLKSKYSFLEYVTVNTTSFSSDSEVIIIDSKINSIEPKKVGKAIQELLSCVDEVLGSDREYFTSEFKGDLGYSFYMKLENMGVKI